MRTRQGAGVVVAALAVLGAAAPSASAVAPAPSHELTVLLGLRRDDAGLEHFAHAVSDPASARYGRYLDVPQIARRFGASAATRRAVMRGLRARGLRGHISATGGWAETTVTIAQAQRLFSTRWKRYRSASGARFVAPAARPRLPADLAGRVTEIVGLSDDAGFRSALVPRQPTYPKKEAQDLDRLAREKGSSIRANTGTLAGCAEGRLAGVDPGRLDIPGYTPNQYLHAYGYDGLHRRGFRGRGQRMALIEIDGFFRSDIEAFGRCFDRRVPPTHITRVGIKKNLAPEGETTLDLEVITAAAPDVSEVQVYETSGTNATLLKGYEKALGRPRSRRASVISASLGQCEPSGFYGSQRDALRLFEQTFRAAAAAGVTLVASSGDTGSSGCAFPGNFAAVYLLAVQHPASSPFVTAVGGTNLQLDAGNKIVEETAWRDPPIGFGGGTGGFSIFFRRPSWQRGPHVGGTQRSVPDLAMVADGVPGWAVYESTGWTAVGGTSAAAPLFASGVAIVDQQAAKAGAQPLGFLNPVIYRLARQASTRRKVFRDVTKLNNDLGDAITVYGGAFGLPLGCCRATRNYDAATGWGSINLPAFSTEARKLTAPKVR